MACSISLHFTVLLYISRSSIISTHHHLSALIPFSWLQGFGPPPKSLVKRREHLPSDLTQRFFLYDNMVGGFFDRHDCFIGVNSFVLWAEGSVTKKLSMTWWSVEVDIFLGVAEGQMVGKTVICWIAGFSCIWSIHHGRGFQAYLLVFAQCQFFIKPIRTS